MSERDLGNPIGKAIILVALVGGGWYFMRNFQVEGLDGIQLKPRNATAESLDDRLRSAFARDAVSPFGEEARQALVAGQQGIPSTLASTRLPLESTGNDSVTTEPETNAESTESPVTDLVTTDQTPIRIGSWALAGFDRNKLAKPHVMDWFTRVARQFDVIALQQLTGRERDLLPRMVEHMNRTGRHYDFLIGPPTGPQVMVPGGELNTLNEQYAFLFDTDRLETDRGQLYTVDDPAKQVSYDPLVAWFRVRSVPQARAWTFTIVNYRVDSDHAGREVPMVARIMAAVATDGRGEDDLILAGMLAADDRQLAHYLGGAACEPAVRTTPTDIFGRYQLSNIVSPRKTTTESLGHGGIVNFPQLLGISVAEAEELTPHLPVFAEFAPSEGN